MNLNLKYIIIMIVGYIVDAYNVPKQMAYWRTKRSFIYNIFLKDKYPPPINPNIDYINYTNIYYLSYEILYEDFFEQHGEVPLLE